MRHTCILLAAVIAAALRPVTAVQPSPHALTIDALLDIKHPSGQVWSPDGSAVAFLWDRGGVQNVWVAAADSGEPHAVTTFTSDLIGSLDWSADGASVLFLRDGHLMRVSRDGGAPNPVWTGGPAISDVTLSPDRSRAAYVRDGELYLRPLAAGTERRLTSGLADVAGATWSPDGHHIAFAFAKSKRVNEDAPYAGNKVVFTRIEAEPSRVGIVDVITGLVVTFPRSSGGEDSPRWLGNTRIVVQRMSEDLRSREIVVADPTSRSERVLHRDTDQKFWSLTYLNAEPIGSPDGKWVAFISDADGWDHLYVVAADGGKTQSGAAGDSDAIKPVQLTRGQFEVARFAWSPDSRRIAFDRNEPDHPGVRHLGVAVMGASWNDARLETLTSGRGTNTNPRWSPDGGRLLFEHTDPRNSADLYIVATPVGGSSDGVAAKSARRLTDSMPSSIDRATLVEPEFVKYRANDGAQVPAYLFVPPGLDRTRKHPAIVWVHGDGINQNYDGWHIHRDYGVYYSVHQYLLQQGFIVLAVDYRGSIGYGRDWRQGHYRDLGGKDYLDIASGAAYLKSLGYVDGDRIGIWGLSYGGFMALQALTVTPDLFRCAIDVAGVEDWNDWYRDPGGPWIRARMGPPAENPELYRRLSPIYHIDRIQRPLLVLHGTSDVNVPFLESVRLIDELTKAEKPVEFRMYPGEFHYFQRAHVLDDAWRAAERFFARHLKGT